MKNSALIAILIIMQRYAVLAQPVAQVEGGYWQFPVIDEIFRSYQLAHPWENTTPQPIGYAAGIGLGWNQNLFAPRALQALGMVHYRYQATSLKAEQKPLTAGFHSASAEVLLRSHPRCLLQEVQNTGQLGTRWYLQLGGGYMWNLPVARKYGQRVNIQLDTPYRAVTGQFYSTFGTGWHALTIGSYILTLETTVNWFPRFTLDGFATAVLGHNEAGLAETAQNSFLVQACLRITRLKKSDNWWDKPRAGDKS